MNVHADRLCLLFVSLAKRLPRMPFPPVTKDTSFDYEAALDENVGDMSVLVYLESWLTNGAIHTACAGSSVGHGDQQCRPPEGRS